MIQLFVEAWDANKDKLQEYFKTHKMEDYNDYKKLVRILFDGVINPYLVDVKGMNPYDVMDDEVTLIDNGSYQGTQLFALHLEAYQPSSWEYVFTFQEYGSCSGCDLLQSIQRYDYDKLPNEEQVKEHMQLCLHLLQRCKTPFNYDEWMEEEWD